jgi:hypothetical protein
MIVRGTVVGFAVVCPNGFQFPETPYNIATIQILHDYAADFHYVDDAASPLPKLAERFYYTAGFGLRREALVHQLYLISNAVAVAL